MKIYIGTDGILRAKSESIADIKVLLGMEKAEVAKEDERPKRYKVACDLCGKKVRYVNMHKAHMHKPEQEQVKSVFDLA